MPNAQDSLTANPKALMKVCSIELESWQSLKSGNSQDKQSHGVGGDKVMKKGGDGAHNWGSDSHELQDELAGQEDAQRDAEEAIAEGDQHPGVESYAKRAGLDAPAPSESTGTLAEEYAEKEGKSLYRPFVCSR